MIDKLYELCMINNENVYFVWFLIQIIQSSIYDVYSLIIDKTNSYFKMY